MIYVAFKMPERLHPHYYTADVITDILSTGASSRLNQRLVKESRAFVQADAYISGSNETGILVIEGRLAENTLPEKAEALIREELDRLINELVDEKELRKAKNKMLTYMNFSDANLLNRISSLAYYEMLGDAWLINKEEAQYEAVSSEDIQEFAKQYLVASKSNTLLYLAAKKSR
jgi:predicted Zn-dependent peptidase